MRAILDPFVFWLPQENVTSEQVKDVLDKIDLVVFLVVKKGWLISTTPSTWDRINRELIRPLTVHVAASALQPKIAALNRILTLIVPPLSDGETWGMRSLFTFANFPDPDGWLNELAKLAAYWTQDEEGFVFLARLLEARNVVIHSSGNCRIMEKTRWKIHVQANGTTQPTGIACVSSMRNIEVSWTTRYDDRLPDVCPADGLSFVPPDDWDSANRAAVQTVQSKPCWVDSIGNGWSDTNTPGPAHHWDVFLRTSQLISRFKGAHVNITRWGTEDRGRKPGSVHH